MTGTKPVIAVVGAGRMGIGIAQVFAYAGCSVEMIDIKKRNSNEADRVMKEAEAQISDNLEIFCSMGILDETSKLAVLGRISYRDRQDAREALSCADIIFEAVPEVLEIKKEAFELICSFSGDKALIASTTSTFLVDTLAGYINFPQRFMNTHWLNPAYLIPLVEVSPASETSDHSLKTMLELLETVGKVPVKCSASPGFIVPRIQALAMNEAARLCEEGVASPEEIDKAVRVGFGLRFAVLGLLEFIDWGGGDILYYASRYLKDSFQSERFTPPDIIVENMEKGNIGMKTGKGFYEFTQRDKAAYQLETIKKFAGLLQYMGMLPLPDRLNSTGS